ncbi:fumarylacetoacetate hydrolase family protein [Achromobacter sp.]|uniref:fumarylacetoacetate hydrolase family protein n=1 Tax=Achromobacter sp. TaxID=134375 RepID=UPI0028A5E1B8|nr:fumarylacetoacetate hydrolase family protein [Achromobacter sp.]
MKIAVFRIDGTRRVGVVSDDGSTVTALDFPTPLAAAGALTAVQWLAEGRALPAQTGPSYRWDQVEHEAPLPAQQRNLFCVGRNYHAHAKELRDSVFKDNDANPESWPIVFTKVPQTVVGPWTDVQLPTGISDKIDYEAELAVVIGKGGRNISRAEAMSHVVAYTVVNDVTARDVQMRHQQWDLGKSFDTFCPMGPWLVTADELDGRKTRVRCWVNGELRQDGNTEDLIFDIPTLIETCSRGITLYPGDVIATGTPAGVGQGLNPPQFLKAGDTVRIEIDGIGRIENRFV